MDSEEEFWIHVWQVIGGVIAVLILTVGSCTTYQNYLVKELIASGADPLLASCAIHGDANNKCLAIGVTRK